MKNKEDNDLFLKIGYAIPIAFVLLLNEKTWILLGIALIVGVVVIIIYLVIDSMHSEQEKDPSKLAIKRAAEITYPQLCCDGCDNELHLQIMEKQKQFEKKKDGNYYYLKGDYNKNIDSLSEAFSNVMNNSKLHEFLPQNNIDTGYNYFIYKRDEPDTISHQGVIIEGSALYILLTYYWLIFTADHVLICRADGKYEIAYRKECINFDFIKAEMKLTTHNGFLDSTIIVKGVQHSKYLHERIDGGPDRRYKDNPLIFYYEGDDGEYAIIYVFKVMINNIGFVLRVSNEALAKELAEKLNNYISMGARQDGELG